jgi:hypothetical protein
MNGRGLIVGFVRPPLREVTLWVVRLEMYVRDREVFKAIEYLVALLYEHLLRVQRAQIHVVLPRTKKKKGVLRIRSKGSRTRYKQKRGTNLDGPPPGEVDASRAVLDRDAPAERDEPAREEGLGAVRQSAHALMHLLRLGRIRVQRHVGVHLRDGRLERAQRVPGDADV